MSSPDFQTPSDALTRSVETDAAEARILGFYDRLRAAIERRAVGRGKVGRGAAEMLLLVPDVFILVARMTLDRRIPSDTRALLGGALAYFLLPVDLVPEAFLGLGGYLDDLVISSAVLQKVFDHEIEAIAEEHWNGSDRVRRVLTQVGTSADWILSGRSLERVKRYLQARGLISDRDSPPRANS